MIFSRFDIDWPTYFFSEILDKVRINCNFFWNIVNSNFSNDDIDDTSTFSYTCMNKSLPKILEMSFAMSCPLYPPEHYHGPIWSLCTNLNAPSYLEPSFDHQTSERSELGLEDWVCWIWREQRRKADTEEQELDESNADKRSPKQCASHGLWVYPFDFSCCNKKMVVEVVMGELWCSASRSASRQYEYPWLDYETNYR